MNTIKLFNRALVNNGLMSFKDVNELAMTMGYIVHPDICNQYVYNWLKEKKRNYNTTFYKDWLDVISKNRFELYIDQVLHYATTYGTNFESKPYIPNDGDIQLPDLKNHKYILPITREELISRCLNMLYSGIALKQETIEDVLSILDDLNYKIDNVELVKNKEAKMFLYKKLDLLPSDASEMVRYMVYMATGKTLLIKNRETILGIKNGLYINLTPLVEKFGYDKLSSVFYRFKPLFLAFRTNSENKECVNKLRRLAVKNHKPQSKGFVETLLSNGSNLHFSQIGDGLKNVNNFKKVQLLQAINVRLKELNTRAFVVRNQKLFIQHGSNAISCDKNYLQILYTVVYKSLSDSLSLKKCKVKFPKQVNLTIPVSEKSFIGNYPLGTNFDFSDSDNVFGINWKGVDGANDLDLSLIDIDGRKYGWNSDYRNENNSIVFSGDMTTANPQATELFYASKGFKPSIVKVNLYNGQPNSKFTFFIAKEKIEKMNRGYMVNPDNIIVNVDMEMDSKEKILGVITENKFVLAQFRSGRGAVSGNSITNLYTEYALNTLDCYVDLKKLLVDSGFEIVEDNADVDLTNLSKDTLMDLIK